MMSWKQFKECVEAMGVTDEHGVEYIDVSHPYHYGAGESDMKIKTSTNHDGEKTFSVHD